MSISFALEGLLGPPYPPSKPECHIPCDEICGVDIHCNWNHRFDPRVSTNYSLHWETAHNVVDHVNTGTSLSGLIGREHLSMYSELPVWVQAESKYGSAKSQVVVFNTGNLALLFAPRPIPLQKIPISQAHGQILGYEVKLSSNHNMTELVNISIAEPRGLLVCDEHQCYLNSSLKSVSSASVSAYNAHGATMHSYLPIPEPGKARGEDFINVTMNTENLTISWDPSFWLPDAKSIDEYVVQYKQAGCHLGKGFDWIRVNKSCTSVTFTAVYNVSASPQDGNKTLELLNLSANQEYEVWIQAVTAAGPGANVTTSFITTQPEHLELKSKCSCTSLSISTTLRNVFNKFAAIFSEHHHFIYEW
nr:receptor-type tyrosine-protein phosphatase F-like [Nerophis lumbriciformis]